MARYECNGLARRVRKHLESDSRGSPHGIDAYVHDYDSGAWQTLETRCSTSAGAQVRDAPPQYQYVWSRRYIAALVLRDMRLTVRRVLEALATYRDREELHAEYPELEDEDVRQALAYAAASLDDKVLEFHEA